MCTLTHQHTRNPVSANNSDNIFAEFKTRHQLSKEEKMSLIPSLFGGRRSNVFDPFSLDVWDPFKDFQFPSSLSAENSGFVNTRVDWKETPEAHVLKADIPGLKKEQVKVEIEDDKVLQISGERNVEKEDKNDKWHRVERSSGKFLRKFGLPENAKVDQVKASIENGVLTVTIPKEEKILLLLPHFLFRMFTCAKGVYNPRLLLLWFLLSINLPL
ncbi:hypothetical protein VIGAN_02213600 [Vigna angularis var. angularis]|uniref:Uncharacterized protein n=1 Tax=Vigna angularis var. angularis TaxID=157739 RepID=A0A0S3RFK5_PHAAN|nr:hypothetical protein VIGAN_02213600 [Vigna angularis var. angularis]